MMGGSFLKPVYRTLQMIFDLTNQPATHKQRQTVKLSQYFSPCVLY